MGTILDELKRAEDNLNSLSDIVGKHKDLSIHKDNLFNRRFSSVLDTFSDFFVIGKRLERNIKKAQGIERVIQQRLKKEDKDSISEEDQKLYQEARELTLENKADFKCFYITAKIFLDEYTALFRFIFKWRFIGDKSITNFYHDLEKYEGEDKQVISFRGSCLKFLKAIDIFITEYRDGHIVHDQEKHKKTTWFFHDMQDGVRFIGGRPSILPKELAYIVANYLFWTRDFVENNLS